MRHPWSRVCARAAISAAALVLGVAGFTPGATAQEKYQGLVVFGDSYADVTLSDKTASNPHAQPDPLIITAPGQPPLQLPPGVGLSLWRVYPVSLAAQLGIKEDRIVDVAVGGATASPTAGSPDSDIVPALIAPGNLPQQVDGFLDTNPSFTFGARDLVTINIGGNDVRALLGVALSPIPEATKNQLNQAIGYFPESFLLNPTKFADKTAEYAVGQIDRLFDAGARTFVLGGFSSFSGLPSLQDVLTQVAQIDPQLAGFVAAGADAYAGAYFNGLQTALAPYAQSGGRFFLLDLARLAQRAVEDPRYGFTPTSFDASGKATGSRCPVDPNIPASTDICGGFIGSADQNPTKYYFGPDGLHLTNTGFELVASYMANIVMAPDIIAVQPGIVMTTTGGFAQSLLSRLDGTHEARAVAGLGPAADAPMGLGATSKARTPEAAASGRFTSFAMGTFLGGSRSDSADAVGYDYDSTSGTAGIEYSISRNLILGLAANYATLSADLRDGADVDLDAIQGAAYLSYATRQLFADALLAYGSHDLGLTRPGVLPGDTIRSSTDASAVALAARAGYLFDLGSLRAGPVAGVTYIHSRVGGYTEKGDDLLTFQVSSQTLDSIAGNLGIRFLAPFRTSGGSLVVPHLNILLEHQFGDHAQTLTTSLTQAPLLPIPTTLPAFDSRTYGRVEGGVTFELGPDLSASVNAGSTFARDDGQDYRVSAGLNYRF